MLFEKLATVSTLWAGWQKVRANHGGAGGDGVTVPMFERVAVQRVEQLAAALAAGRYRPGPFRHVAIPGKRGGQRGMAIPCLADRVVQTAAAQLVAPVLEPAFEPARFTAWPERGLTHAVAAQGDIARAFDEIPHDPLLAQLQERTGDARLVDLVALWLGAYAPGGVGIPAGTPISPLLCNLHLDAVDEAVADHGLRLVRHADDFVILTTSETGAVAGIERIAALLRDYGLRVNPDKSRIVPADQALRLLGHGFVRSMAWKEGAQDDADNAPPLPDAPPEELLEQYGRQLNAETAAADRAQDLTHRGARRVLHIVEPGARLTIRGHAFLAEGPEEAGADGRPRRQGSLLEHASNIDRIEIGPGAEADWAALQLAAAHGIPLAMVDGWGATQGWVTGAADLRARRVAAQARFLADDERRAAVARAILRGRIRARQKMLKRLNRTRKDSAIADAAKQLKDAVRRLPVRVAPDAASKHETAAAGIYWPAYARAIDADFGVNLAEWRRRGRLPPDPLNACLGFLAALLERDVRVAVERAGLHPGIGALHAGRNDDDALVYDLTEAFRAPVTETVLAALIGRRALRRDMFVIRTDVDPDREAGWVCRIEPEARRAMITGHEGWLARPITSRRSGRMVTWRDLIEEEARAIGVLFDGQADAFKPYEMDY